MTTVELLQQIGLNKYEAEAYYTLLTQEPLTGYELGKRSQVPLSRSYEILERLAQKGHSSLAALPRSDTSSEFWVLRGRQHILARVQAMIAEAQQVIYLSLPANSEADVVDTLALARARGCSVFRSTTADMDYAGAEHILFLVDDREALVGLLAPAEGCQAVISANEGLVAALRGYFANQVPAKVSAP